MTQLEHDFIRSGRVREKRIIPLYSRTGQELHPLFAGEVWKSLSKSIRSAIRKKRAPTQEQMRTLAEFVTGEFTDHNGNKCPVPNRVRSKAVTTTARLMAHV